jgi:hypothetical protein
LVINNYDTRKKERKKERKRAESSKADSQARLPFFLLSQNKTRQGRRDFNARGEEILQRNILVLYEMR